MAASNEKSLTLLRRPQVEARTGLSRSAIYSKLHRNPKRPADFDPTFPRPVPIGVKAVGWLAHEIDDWIAAQVRKARESQGRRG
ncbi:MAG: AlpA family phage regulatory protein [Pseudomonadota bacterium]|nr:AlpA family phage regulatory protein [Pseudomonadota bacterium]